MCFYGTKKALRLACGPLIALVGCHMKYNYGGILLIAIRRDPTYQYSPITFRVVELESKDYLS